MTLSPHFAIETVFVVSLSFARVFSLLERQLLDVPVSDTLWKETIFLHDCLCQPWL